MLVMGRCKDLFWDMGLFLIRNFCWTFFGLEDLGRPFYRVQKNVRTSEFSILYPTIACVQFHKQREFHSYHLSDA